MINKLLLLLTQHAKKGMATAMLFVCVGMAILNIVLATVLTLVGDGAHTLLVYLVCTGMINVAAIAVASAYCVYTRRQSRRSVLLLIAEVVNLARRRSS